MGIRYYSTASGRPLPASSDNFDYSKCWHNIIQVFFFFGFLNPGFYQPSIRQNTSLWDCYGFAKVTFVGLIRESRDIRSLRRENWNPMISVCWPAAEFVVTALVGGSKPNGVPLSGKFLIMWLTFRAANSSLGLRFYWANFFFVFFFHSSGFYQPNKAQHLILKLLWLCKGDIWRDSFGSRGTFASFSWKGRTSKSH